MTEEFYDKLKYRYDYNPLTGDIVRLFSHGSNRIGSPVGHIINCNYRVVKTRAKTVLCHRLAFYIMEGYLPEQIDHIDGNRSNNKWLNLRECTRAENQRNLAIRSDNKSGYRGVREYGDYNKWKGSVKLNGKEHYKYGFKTPELASIWVVAKSKELYGEFYNENRYKEEK